MSSNKSKFQTDDKISATQFVKSKEYINKQMRGLVCPHGRKHCGICDRDRSNEKQREETNN